VNDFTLGWSFPGGQAEEGRAYITPTSGAWTTPGPATPTTTVTLADGSQVTYAWYRFIDQPVFQQYHWDEGRKQCLQKLVAEIHARWGIDREYMPPPSAGSLVRLDPALIVSPPAGMETGYVPNVVGQRGNAAWTRNSFDQVKYIQDDTDWAAFEKECTLPDWAARCNILLLVEGEGSAWLDEVRDASQ
jgi:hypothetical protein